MIFRVTMKDPDVLYEAINDALKEDLSGFDDDEREAIKEVRYEKIAAIA